MPSSRGTRSALDWLLPLRMMDKMAIHLTRYNWSECADLNRGPPPPEYYAPVSKWRIPAALQKSSVDRFGPFGSVCESGESLTQSRLSDDALRAQRRDSSAARTSVSKTEDAGSSPARGATSLRSDATCRFPFDPTANRGPAGPASAWATPSAAGRRLSASSPPSLGNSRRWSSRDGCRRAFS